MTDCMQLTKLGIRTPDFDATVPSDAGLTNRCILSHCDGARHFTHRRRVPHEPRARADELLLARAVAATTNGCRPGATAAAATRPR